MHAQAFQDGYLHKQAAGSASVLKLLGGLLRSSPKDALKGKIRPQRPWTSTPAYRGKPGQPLERSKRKGRVGQADGLVTGMMMGTPAVTGIAAGGKKAIEAYGNSHDDQREGKARGRSMYHRDRNPERISAYKNNPGLAQSLDETAANNADVQRHSLNYRSMLNSLDRLKGQDKKLGEQIDKGRKQVEKAERKDIKDEEGVIRAGSSEEYGRDLAKHRAAQGDNSKRNAAIGAGVGGAGGYAASKLLGKKDSRIRDLLAALAGAGVGGAAGYQIK